ncbi:MAG: glycosyltransferase family 39 protein [Candidatus Poribacteria bacterium]|nr:glycosyltransferase family 39 protein [Candidatus Poribacteria bacterium]
MSLGSVDECCHALVAKNLLKHPFKPTLIDVPYLPYKEETWSENHVWLHKPILPLWQICLSYWILGVSTFALRLPSAVLSTFAAGITYLIGTQLLTRRAALFATAIQAFSWFIMQLTHGYQFSDAIDISLLFYCEIGVYGVVRAIKTGKWCFIVLAGIGQGLAFLSKTYPAFIITGVAFAMWSAPKLSLAKKEDCRLCGQHILGMLIITIFVAGPWMLYTALQYPVEFKIEHNYIFRHLTEDIEGWRAPWYKVFLYSAQIFNLLTAPIAVAVCCSIPHLFQRKNIGLFLLYAWGLGVLLPFSIATTKTPSATLISMPAFLLILGNFVERTIYPGPKNSHYKRRILLVWTALLVILCFGEGIQAWRVTQTHNEHTLSEIAEFTREHLPKNAVLLTETNVGKGETHYDYLRLMFFTEYTARPYYLKSAWKSLSQQVEKHGGIPYIVTFRELNLPILFKSHADKRTIYLSELSE